MNNSNTSQSVDNANAKKNDLHNGANSPPSDSRASNARPSHFAANKLTPLILVVASVLFTWLLVQNERIDPFLQLLAFAGICAATLMKVRMAVPIVMFLYLAFWLGEHGRGYSVLHLPMDAFNILVLLGYALTSLRLSDIEYHFRLTEASPVQQPVPGSDKTITWKSFRPLSAGWVLLPVSMFLAIGLLVIIPIDHFSRERIGITGPGLRAIQVLWLLVVAWAAACGFLRFLTRQNVEPEQARVYARSLFCKQIAKEMRGIERRRYKEISR